MYAMYLRKSRQDMELELLGQGETLARHRETLMNLARKNLHTIGEIYAEVVSGETIRARPEMKRLLADVSAGRWEGVYCMEVERLSRGDPVDQGRVAEVFTVSQTRIITPRQKHTSRKMTMTWNTLNFPCSCPAGNTRPSTAAFRPDACIPSGKENTSAAAPAML